MNYVVPISVKLKARIRCFGVLRLTLIAYKMKLYIILKFKEFVIPITNNDCFSSDEFEQKYLTAPARWRKIK
jgi:hypothetical protein